MKTGDEPEMSELFEANGAPLFFRVFDPGACRFPSPRCRYCRPWESPLSDLDEAENLLLSFQLHLIAFTVAGATRYTMLIVSLALDRREHCLLLPIIAERCWTRLFGLAEKLSSTRWMKDSRLT